MAAAGRQDNREQLSRVGAELRGSRRRHRLTQRAVARLTGLSDSSISDIERGWGGSYSTDALQLAALAVGRRLIVTLSADELQGPADAGHLAMQELVLRLARARGIVRTFELTTKPADPARSADVGLRDDRRRQLVLVECWNSIGDVGSAARSSERKRAEAEQMAVAVGPLGQDDVVRPYRVALCWIVRATARNRALVGRYPEVFATRFPGSSTGWVRALSAGHEPPHDPGLVWCDVQATRLFAWRRRA